MNVAKRFIPSTKRASIRSVASGCDFLGVAIPGKDGVESVARARQMIYDQLTRLYEGPQDEQNDTWT